MTNDTRDLNDEMDFDHVVRVHADGSVTDAEGIHAPDLRDGELSDPRWSLMDGYSRQDHYHGPIMHSSEYIGGGMARDILSTPGVYVALVDYSDDDDTEPDGWAVARLDETA